MRFLKKKIKVYCKRCKEWHDEDDVGFVDIEEDMQGADILTFICPVCQSMQKSRRYG